MGCDGVDCQCSITTTTTHITKPCVFAPQLRKEEEERQRRIVQRDQFEMTRDLLNEQRRLKQEQVCVSKIHIGRCPHVCRQCLYQHTYVSLKHNTHTRARVRVRAHTDTHTHPHLHTHTHKQENQHNKQQQDVNRQGLR